MEEMKFGGILYFVIILLVVYFFFGGNIGNRNNYGAENCNGISNCDTLISEIKDSARNLYSIENTARNTQDVSNVNTREIMAQNSRIYEAQLQERIFDLKAENSALKTEASLTDKFNALSLQSERCCCEAKFRDAELSNQISSLTCQLPKVPPVWAQVYTPNGCSIPCNA